MEFFTKEEIIQRYQSLKSQFSHAANDNTVRADLNLALLIASSSLFFQKLKSGHDYMIHPLTVGMRNTRSTTKQIIGFLHDVVEDSDWTVQDLRTIGFSDRVVDAVDAMTHREGELYFDSIERCSLNDDAIDKKLEDLSHNLDQSRNSELPQEKDIERIKKYQISLAYLLNIKKGKIEKGVSVYDFVDSHGTEFENQREEALMVVSKFSSDTTTNQQMKFKA